MHEIVLDSSDACNRAKEYLKGWASKNTKVVYNESNANLLLSRNIDKEIELALSDRVDLPSGGHLNIQPTEALTVIDVNSGRFTSSRTQAQTVKRTNLEAATEISRQLRLRNIGGMVIVDFIDMESRKDQQQVLELFQKVLEDDRAKPQLGQLSDLGLVELTRHRQGQSIRELFTKHCTHCNGLGIMAYLTLSQGQEKIPVAISLKSNALASNQINSASKNNFLKAASAHGKKIVPVVSSNMRYNKFYQKDAEINLKHSDNGESDEVGTIEDNSHDTDDYVKNIDSVVSQVETDYVVNDNDPNNFDLSDSLLLEPITDLYSKELFEKDYTQFDSEDLNLTSEFDLSDMSLSNGNVLQDVPITEESPIETENTKLLLDQTDDSKTALSFDTDIESNQLDGQNPDIKPVIEDNFMNQAQADAQSYLDAEFDPNTGIYRLRIKSNEEVSSKTDD